MNPEQWQRVKAVVADALEHETARRAEFVADACGEDVELRREVESMLGASGQRVDRVIDRMANVRSTDNDGLTGVRLGAYEIIRETGRGGMGAVYLARRADEEFEKEVAIKLLKRGTDTDEVLRRFRAERQILARLDHPNIARLLDGGTTPDGLPYFAMEYVDGVPITDFCGERNLSIRERVELFLKVCAAVQFAHRNLVVHRDLKPGNVLITADGEPKLLDFGIAKLLAGDDEFAQLTVQDQQRLTPAYASPEQVRGEAVTTVSDVYALGALLFELLAGRSPHAFANQRPTPTELLRVVVEQGAPRASSVARDADAARQLRGDLDNILETALRKEPEHRYSGVTAFAEDLQRYLSRRPVRARPPTLRYRTSRFISRNKLGVAAGVLLLATLVGGIAATAWQARKAERRFQQVRKLARAVVFDYHDLIAALPGATAARERLVRDALEYLDNLAREAGNDRVLLRELATAYEKIGKVQGNSYHANLGDTEGAARSYAKSAELRSRLLASDSGNAELLSETALSYEGVGDVQYSKNDLHGALASYRRAIELGQRALAAAPENDTFRHYHARTHARLGDLLGNEQYGNLGDTAGALTAFRTAQELVEPLHAKDPNDAETISVLANAVSRVGMLSCASGDVGGGLAAHRRAVAMMEHAVTSHPHNQSWVMELLAAKHWLRFALEDNAQFEEAIALSREVLARLEAVSAGDPKNTNVRRNIAITHSMLGRNLLRVGDVPGAIASHQTALQMIEQLSSGKGGARENDKDVAVALWGLANAHSATGQHEVALQHYRDALAIREPVIAADPTNAKARDDVASIYADMGLALRRAGRIDQAAEAFAKSLPIAEQLSASAPTNARLRARLASRYADTGRAHLQSAVGDRKLACDYLRKSAAVWQELRDTNRLMPADAAAPEQTARDLATCEAALSEGR